MPILNPGQQVNLPAGRNYITITAHGGAYRIVFHSAPTPGERRGILPVNGNNYRIQVNPNVASTLYNTGNAVFTWI